SSRRRHTRSKREWSTDVCSSDRGIKEGLSFAKIEINYLLEKYEGFLQQIEEIDNYVTDICSNLDETSKITQIKGIGIVTASGIRSEERRVGKERRYRSNETEGKR